MEPATNWDERYAVDHYIYGTSPNEYLRGTVHLLSPGARVLVAADGEGRNGVWLAEQGMRVVSVDRSAAGVNKAARLAAERGVAIDAVCADLAIWEPPPGSFDAAIAIFAHFPPDVRPRIHSTLVRALRPGGVLILEAFHPRQLGRASGGPRDVTMLYDAETLQRDFADLTILELGDRIVTLDEGPKHQGEGHVVQLLARR